jgi:1,2-diacylglycerol 3-alpha-glucosyltransferase
LHSELSDAALSQRCNRRNTVACIEVLMRILIAGSTYPPQTNGQAVFTGSLANNMAQMGHAVMVMTPSETGRPYRCVENNILRWAVRSLDLSFFHRGLCIAFGYKSMVNEALDTFQPDIIHLQDSAPLNRCLLGAAHRRNIPVVITHHIGPAVGAPYFTWFTDLLNGRMALVVWRWIISFLNQADVITAPSYSAAEMLRRHRLIPSVWPISCGVTVDQFRPNSTFDRSALRAKWKLAADQPLLLYVGRLDWEKRPEVLLQAMSMLPQSTAQLVLVGTGRAEKTLKSLSDKLQLGNRVRFLGDVQHDRVPELFAACDVFVMPGDAESLSIATLEAMASGKPVLAANSMALPELVQPGENGLLFDPRNPGDAAMKMKWLIDHPHDWQRLGQASLKKVAGHSVPTVMHHFETLYSDTIFRFAAHQSRPQALPVSSPVFWLTQRLLPHLKVIFLLVFLLLSSILTVSETVAAPHIRLENLRPLNLDSAGHILIISPHPDDSVLVAGGLIQNAFRQGIFVQTVIVTDGEEPGFLPTLVEARWPLEAKENRNVHQYQADSRAASNQLGIPQDQVIFLGYPSGQWTVDRLLLVEDLVPVELRASQSSMQSALVEDFRQLFAAYSPDIIILPHPEDNHPDHRAVSQAARQAAADQFSGTPSTQPLVLGYLVDYETYPDDVDLINLSPLLPPARLSDPAHSWFNVPLDEEQLQIKRKAITLFPLASERISWVLASFARPNELFTELTITHMPVILPKTKLLSPPAALLKQFPEIRSELFGED